MRALLYTEDLGLTILKQQARMLGCSFKEQKQMTLLQNLLQMSKID